MSEVNIEGALADKILRHHVASEANVPRDVLDRVLDALTPHVAAVLREQIAAWLGDVITADRANDTYWRTYRRPGVTPEAAMRTALAALVACVDPSPSESGSTDPEVRQSADRTSAPSRVPGEET